MSTVVFCTDTRLDRKVAIKFIQDKKAQRRIRDELSALLKLRSKHVVQVYDAIELEDGELGIVQEFIEGNDLFAEESPRQSANAYLKTLWQIAAGIADVHAVDVIHRDIKPNNMKLDPEGIIKIFDFGLARDAGPKAATKGFVGTHGFAAPELYARAPVFTKAVDTYAYGATALFIAAEDLPAEFEEIPPKKVARSLFKDVLPDLSAAVVDLLDTCVAYSPADRPAMASVRDLLGQHLLYDRHQALIVFRGKPSYLSAANREVVLNVPSEALIRIRYDGLRFSITHVEGHVYINNRGVTVGEEIPSSCVIALRSPALRATDREFVTFDVSHPEIAL